MTCDQAMRLVEKLADGEAKPSERKEAESHLESCAECRSHYHFVVALESASEKIDWPEPPEAYWQHFPSKVLARLAREQPVEGRNFWQKLLAPPVLRFGAVAATVTVVVAVGFSVLRDDQLHPEPELAQAPASVGKRQADDKAAGVAPQPAPLLAVEADAVAPEESGRIESASRATEPAPSALRQALAEKEEGESADFEYAADVANPAGLAGGVADQSFRDSPAAAPPSRRENRALRSLAEAPGEPADAMVATEEAMNAEPAPAAASVELARKEAPARARSSVVNDCAEWRDYLARNGDEGSESLEARYRVALCSLERYTAEPSDEARATAEQDAEAFLAMESDGERADDVRERALQLRR